MSVPAIESLAPTALSALNQAPAAPAPAAGALTNQDFMMLLVASLKYQDPSEPMKTQELMQQTTAMTTVEHCSRRLALPRNRSRFSNAARQSPW